MSSPAAAERKLPYKPRLSRAARQAAIEAAASQLFAARGYDAVSTDDLVAAADISRPTFYAHFSGKRELYRRLVSQSSKLMIHYMRDRVRSASGPPAQQVAMATDAFFAFVEDHPFAWRMLFREPPSDPTLSGASRRIHDQATANVAELLRRIRPPTHPLNEQALLVQAEALKSAQQGLAAWWYDHRDVPRSELVKAIVAMAGLDPSRLPR